MQSSYSLPKDAAAIWRCKLETQGLLVHPVIQDNEDASFYCAQETLEGTWDVYWIEAPQVKVMVDIRLKNVMPADIIQFDVHWCSDVGLPAPDASRKIALRLLTILNELGAIPEHSTIQNVANSNTIEPIMLSVYNLNAEDPSQP